MEIPDILVKEGFEIGLTDIREKVDVPKEPQLPEGMVQGSAEATQWYEEWNKTEEGKKYQSAKEKERKQKRYPIVMNMDGSYRADDVPAGVYEINIQLNDPPVNRIMGMSGILAAMGRT